MSVCHLLDFGEESVKDVETKLQILKFDYSWTEEVEKQERMMEVERQHTATPRKENRQQDRGKDDKKTASKRKEKKRNRKRRNVSHRELPQNTYEDPKQTRNEREGVYLNPQVTTGEVKRAAGAVDIANQRSLEAARTVKQANKKTLKRGFQFKIIEDILRKENKKWNKSDVIVDTQQEVPKEDLQEEKEHDVTHEIKKSQYVIDEEREKSGKGRKVHHMELLQKGEERKENGKEKDFYITQHVTEGEGTNDAREGEGTNDATEGEGTKETTEEREGEGTKDARELHVDDRVQSSVAEHKVKQADMALKREIVKEEVKEIVEDILRKVNETCSDTDVIIERQREDQKGDFLPSRDTFVIDDDDDDDYNDEDDDDDDGFLPRKLFLYKIEGFKNEVGPSKTDLGLPNDDVACPTCRQDCLYWDDATVAAMKEEMNLKIRRFFGFK